MVGLPAALPKFQFPTTITQSPAAASTTTNNGSQIQGAGQLAPAGGGGVANPAPANTSNTSNGTNVGGLHDPVANMNPTSTVTNPAATSSVYNIPTVDGSTGSGTAAYGSASGGSSTAGAYGPSSTGSPYVNTHNTGGGAGAAVSGVPGFGAISDAQSFIQDPNAANFTIGGADTYRTQLGDLSKQYGQVGAQAGDFAQAQSNLGYQQGQNFQNSLNQQTSDFTNNASGLGNYDNSLAGNGTGQQQDAYNSIANLAAGNGPSLAGKNLQAGLNSENQAIQAQAMTNQGLNGAGNTQRNLLNAQAANANNFAQAGGQASAAEQIGALGQQSSAATNLRSANQAQASAASSAGLAARSQNLSAMQNAQNSTLASQQLTDNNAITAQQLGLNTQLQSAAGQGNAYAQQYNTNVLQQGQNAAYDAANRATGNTRAGINIEGQLSEAQQAAGATSTAGNVISALGQGAASLNNAYQGGGDDYQQQTSDENMKTDIMKDKGTDSALSGILDSLVGSQGSAGYAMPTPATDDGAITQLPLQPLVSSGPQTPIPETPTSGLGGGVPQKKSSGSSGGGSDLGGALSAIGTIIGLALL